MDNTAATQESETNLTLLPDELIVHLIASGLIELVQQAQTQTALSLPYPAPLQRGLNRLVLRCVRHQRQPPQSMMDLLNWCRQPLASWELDLPRGSVTEDETLLDEELPTATCEAWARSGRDIEADLHEARLLLDVMQVCQRAQDPQAYTAFRRMLIERPVLTAFEFQMILNEAQFDLLVEHLRAAYQPAPRSAIDNGAWATCAICGNLLLRSSRRHERICEDEQCRAQGRSAPSRILPLRDEVVWLRRDLRRYVAAPGRTELRLAARLEGMGLKVELWPAFDQYDLRITFPHGTVWAIDVKDWRNPFLLARHVNRRPFPSNPPWDRAFFVFPDLRRSQRTDYLRAFRTTCRILSDQVQACFESDLLRHVKEELERGHYA